MSSKEKKNKGGRPKGSTKGMGKRELIKEISDNTRASSELVEDILDNLTDIIIRESVLNEKFHLTRAFDIYSFERKGSKRYDVTTGENVEFPDTRILEIKLSEEINYLFRNKMRNEANARHGVTRENWRDILDENGEIKSQYK